MCATLARKLSLETKLLQTCSLARVRHDNQSDTGETLESLFIARRVACEEVANLRFSLTFLDKLELKLEKESQVELSSILTDVLADVMQCEDDQALNFDISRYFV
jgi:hypothetical protein